MKKILTSTIPAWSQSTGANTFAAILEDIKGIDVANIYVRANLPDSKVCSRYFQILESNVIKSIFNRKIQTGKEVAHSTTIENSEDSELKSERKCYAYFSKNRNPIFLWGRELLWKFGRWNSKDLDNFLTDFNPDIFFFPIESYIYFNRLNSYIIQKCKPKMVIGFLWDDNFTYKQKRSLPYYINRYFTRKSVRKLVKQCDEVFTICPKMKTECDATFHINSTIITKPIRGSEKNLYSRNKKNPIRLIYTGSLIIGRDKSLIALANAVKEINKEGQRALLDIYTNTSLKDDVYEKLNIPGCCQIKGSIPQSQVFEEQEKSDILVFVESFENKTARLSFSTKITDYLSSNRCILAIGPNDISSMEYFKEEDAAVCCNSEISILPALQSLIDNPKLIEKYAEKGFDCGVRNHSLININSRISSIFKLG